MMESISNNVGTQGVCVSSDGRQVSGKDGMESWVCPAWQTESSCWERETETETERGGDARVAACLFNQLSFWVQTATPI